METFHTNALPFDRSHIVAERRLLLVLTGILCGLPDIAAADDLKLSLRYQTPADVDSTQWTTKTYDETWKPEETAIIVCDVWDLHHCLNAVRRLEQFAPRLNQVLNAARDNGVTIIHSPSDCMPAYDEHPARKRAQQAPVSPTLPPDVKAWCSVIPAEERANYPIDQSDGGEDDDPAEHAAWAEKLRAMGRQPGTPWKSQNKLITIDAERDYISDRGDEVWNVLEQNGIRNVILTGVHLNMCVLGRPFGLRQMVRNGKHVVLMRDMTDTMYNPARWPYVSHQRGTALMVAHVERYVCATITSDQVIGGKPFELQPVSTLAGPGTSAAATSRQAYQRRWVTMSVPGSWVERSGGVLNGYRGPGWYRCVVRIPQDWTSTELRLQSGHGDGFDEHQAFLNGQQLQLDNGAFTIPREAVEMDDANLLVVRISSLDGHLSRAPVLVAASQRLELAGRWQFRIGDDPQFAKMPLPAKFGGSADIVFTPAEPLFVARPVTRPNEFTTGIEGPACDSTGHIYAVNFSRQGTIGRVTPLGAGEVFLELPKGSVGNGIRFDQQGNFYVADYMQHNILKVDPHTRKVEVYAHNAAMNQPNDLAIAGDGTLYASDPNWQDGTGQLWRIDRDGTTTRLAEGLGTTNGIEVSPDDRTLYVNESKQRNIWAFTINADKSISNKRLLRQFDDHGFDGMRCDVSGNLYVTRYGKGTVVKLSPEGELLREIRLPGHRPSNICFGGPDGRTAYVTEVEFTRLVSFRVDEPGLSFQRRSKGPVADDRTIGR